MDNKEVCFNNSLHICEELFNEGKERISHAIEKMETWIKRRELNYDIDMNNIKMWLEANKKHTDKYKSKPILLEVITSKTSTIP